MNRSNIAVAVALCALGVAGGPVARAGTPLTNVTFVAFDTETTGLSRHSDRVVELAAIKFRNGVVIDEKRWLIDPQMPIPAAATRVHGITDQMVKDAPHFPRVMRQFVVFMDDAVLLAHNAPFDVGIIHSELSRNAMDAPTNAVLDTLPLTRAWFPEIKRHNLESLATHLQLQPERYHRGLDDTLTLVEVFRRGLQKMGPAATIEDIERMARGPLFFGADAPRRGLNEGAKLESRP